MDVLGAGKWIHPHAFWGADNFFTLSLEVARRSTGLLEKAELELMRNNQRQSKSFTRR
jgi:hypothetical protein